MQDNSPKLAFNYKPVGKWNKGRPRKRCKDQFLEEGWRMQA
jgi:hypothetical protein